MALVLSKQSADREDYDVLSGRMVVGRISQKASAEWVWSITGLHASPGIMVSVGRMPTLEEAKGEMEKNWHRWLEWARLHEELPVHLPNVDARNARLKDPSEPDFTPTPGSARTVGPGLAEPWLYASIHRGDQKYYVVGIITLLLALLASLVYR